MKLSKAKLFRELIKTTLEFHKRKMWNEYGGAHTFAVRLPGEEYPWFGAIMGDDDSESIMEGDDNEKYGLFLIRGPNGAAQQAAMLYHDHETDEFESRDMDFLGFTINPLHEVPEEMRKHLKKACFPARRETLVPFFFVKEPGTPPRNVNSDEARAVLCILKAILKTSADGTFDPGLFAPDEGVLTLTIDTDNPLDPEVEVSREIYEYKIPAFDSDFSEPEDPEAVPDPDDLDAWKEVDSRVIGRIVKATRELVNGVTMTKYFGSIHDADKMLSKFDERGVRGCYIDWLAFCYRRNRRKKTAAEELLATDLPKADRMVLESRAAAVPTLCRVVGAGKGPIVNLEDIFTGKMVEIHDYLMAEGVRRNKTYDMIVPVRYYAAGNFTFIAMVGPNFNDTHLPSALEFLAKEGLHPTDKGFEKNPEILGRMWIWLEELLRRPMPWLCNTDNEPIEWHTASYKIADMAGFRKALLARDDVEPEGDDSQTDTFVWFREEENPKPGMGDLTLLGRIRLVGDEAVTEVNSAGRHERMKEWLSRMPGVTYVDVRRESMQKLMNDRPLDDELDDDLAGYEPERIPPELIAAMKQQIEEYYMNWLDQPIPALGNKTPRQCCRTKSGRAKVAALIRGMGSPTIGDGPRGVEVPKQAMLRELGLE